MYRNKDVEHNRSTGRLMMLLTKSLDDAVGAVSDVVALLKDDMKRQRQNAYLLEVQERQASLSMIFHFFSCPLTNLNLLLNLDFSVLAMWIQPC